MNIQSRAVVEHTVLITHYGNLTLTQLEQYVALNAGCLNNSELSS